MGKSRVNTFEGGAMTPVSSCQRFARHGRAFGMNVGVVLVAAGRGARMGGVDKGALVIDGRSVLSYALAAFMPITRSVVVVVAADRVAAWQAIRAAEAWEIPTTIVAGGAVRQESVRIGVDALGKERRM